MKLKHYIILLILGIILIPQVLYAQVDFNKKPNDDLGDNEDEFQELFFEALKQKGIDNYQRSADAFLKCIAIDKSPAILYFELGKNYVKLKNFGAAEDALKQAISKEPDNEWYLDELYGYYISQNELSKALKAVKQLVKYHPDYKEDLASLYVKMEKFDEALKILDELDASHGVSVSRDVLRNRIYKITGRTKDQIKNLESRVDNNPEKESNYIALIYRYSQNNEKDKAFKTAKKLLEINPKSELVHLALYKLYLDKNQSEEAIKSMKIVVKSNTIKPEAKHKVLSDFVKFVSKNPEYESALIEATSLLDGKANAKTLNNLASYHIKTGNKQKALYYFEEALKLNSNSFDALKNVLLLHIDLNQYDIAATKSAKAIDKYPAQPLCYLINGVALNALLKPKKALETLESGLDWVVDNTRMEADFYRELSTSYELLNNTAKAKSFKDKANALESKS